MFLVFPTKVSHKDLFHAVYMKSVNGSQINAYQWKDSTGFGSKYPNGTGQSTGFSASKGVVYSNSSNYLAQELWRAIRWDKEMGFGAIITGPGSFQEGGYVSSVDSGAVIPTLENNLGKVAKWDDEVGFNGSWDLGGYPETSSIIGNMSAMRDDVVFVQSLYDTSSGDQNYIIAWKWDAETGLGIRYPGGTSNFASGSLVASEKAIFSNQSVSSLRGPRARKFDTETGAIGGELYPATRTSGLTNSTVVSPDRKVVFCTSRTAPYLTAYQWDEDNGFGAKYPDPPLITDGSDPDRLVATGKAVIVAFSGNSRPLGWLRAWRWDNTTGWGSEFPAPDVQPDNPTNGNYLALAKN